MKLELNPKITAEHLARKAIIYLRQSSLHQVKHNKESQRLQYALAEKAKALGFKQVDIIDTDLGSSAGMGAQQREGFKQLLASVALGDVGLILSRELSRLSRTDKDWCHLIELCRVFNTLIGDAEQIYDTNLLDDQLILGIKGTLSIVELNGLKSRLLQGQEEKAKRGELVRVLQPGYVCQDNCIVKDPNLRVQQAMTLVFKTFQRLGSIRQTYRWFHDERIELPVNHALGGKFQIMWKLPTQSFIGHVLHNPLYAGAYVYGRRQIEVIIRDGKPSKRQGRVRPLEQTKVFIRDHHEGYISWQTYERIQAMIQNNGGILNHDDEVQAVRDGHGLLTGLLRCGRCGRKLSIRYWGKSGTAARYLCKGDFDTGGVYCLGFGGSTTDKRVAKEILQAISPLGIEASLVAIEQLRHAEDDQRQALQRQWQQLDYEAQRAFEQYNQVDPANRLVAEVLEKRWNEKLEAARCIQVELDTKPTPKTIDQKQKANIMAMGKQFDTVWDDPACPMMLKKKIARILMKEIMADLDEQTQQLHFIIHWHGGCHTAFDMPKPMSGAKAHKTRLEDRALIEKMAVRYADDEIARVLSKLDRRTGKGQRWTKARVAYVRKKYRIAAPDNAERDPTILTLGQAIKQYKVSDTTLMRLINENLLPAAQIAPYAPLEIKRKDLENEPVLSILATLKKTGKLILEGDSLNNQRCLFE